MTDEKRRKILLGLLALVLIVTLVKRLLPSLSVAGPSSAGRGAATGPQRAGGARVDATEIVELDLEALTKSAGQFTPGRDPFNYGAQPPPPPPPPPPREIDEDRIRRAAEAARVAEAAREQSAATPPTPQPPPVDVVYLGSFGSSSRRLAVFSDGAEIYNALEGSVIKDKFVVVQVGLESADLGFVGFPEVPPERLGAGE